MQKMNPTSAINFILNQIRKLKKLPGKAKNELAMSNVGKFRTVLVIKPNETEEDKIRIGV
jgi:hypothetical protein